MTEPRVIVLGTQKSGTSAIAHLFAELCGLSKRIDLPRSLRPQGHALLRGEMTLEEFVAKHGELFDSELVKIPSLTFVADEIAEFFPGAQLVGVVRDPRATLRSLLSRRGLPGNREKLAWFHKIAMRIQGRALLTEVFAGEQKEDDYIVRLAKRWNRAADALLELCPRVHLVRYEDFMGDKIGVLETLAADLGLPVSGEIACRIDHQFQPPGKSGVTYEEFFGAENLTKIEKVCGSRMGQLYGRNQGTSPEN